MSILEFRNNNVSESDIKGLQGALSVKHTLASILVSRGITTEDSAKAFLSPTLKDHLPDPNKMKNLTKAAELLIDSVIAGEPITIYSDYDVDGITSGAQLLMYLRALGGCADTYVTNRFVDGYGLSDLSVRKIVAGNTKVLVTVDCGISNVSQIEYAKHKGLKVVVLDHHQPGEQLPPADVVVDPAQEGCPFGEHKLAAAGVVWMLLVLLRQVAKKKNLEAENPKNYLDLAAMGTICDMVPLTGLNRVIAHRGVEAVRGTKRVGVQALKEVAGMSVSKRFSSGNISYGIGPRINAAGRLGDASEVLELLTTDDAKRARNIAEKIDKINTERRTIENNVKDSCFKWIEESPERVGQNAFAIYGEHYHVGVIGIAAQRIVEQYHRPAAVMGLAEQEIDGVMQKVVKGSVRSIKSFHVANGLSEMSDILISHGGHAAAGGFSFKLEHLEDFQQRFISIVEKALEGGELEKKIVVDVEVNFKEIDFDLVDQLSKLAPFGVGNPSPVLLAKDVEVSSVSQLASKHLRLKLKQNDEIRNAVAWNMFGNTLLRKGSRVTIAFKADINTYKGMSSVQLQILEAWEA